jgi:rubrerythrin
MCSNSVAAGALGGIQGTLDLLARNQSRQNNMTGALAQQAQIANQWQTTAFNLQSELDEWKTWGRKMEAGWRKEKQVSADLRQQLERAQEALQAEKKLRDDEFNERVEKYNRLVRKTNRLIDCLTAVKAQPGSAVALIAALEAELKAQQA